MLSLMRMDKGCVRQLGREKFGQDWWVVVGDKKKLAVVRGLDNIQPQHNAQ
jgi:hypothetical protein